MAPTAKNTIALPKSTPKHIKLSVLYFTKLSGLNKVKGVKYFKNSISSLTCDNICTKKNIIPKPAPSPTENLSSSNIHANIKHSVAKNSSSKNNPKFKNKNFVISNSPSNNIPLAAMISPVAYPIKISNPISKTTNCVSMICTGQAFW